MWSSSYIEGKSTATVMVPLRSNFHKIQFLVAGVARFNLPGKEVILYYCLVNLLSVLFFCLSNSIFSALKPDPCPALERNDCFVLFCCSIFPPFFVVSDCWHHAPVAQLVEHRALTREVVSLTKTQGLKITEEKVLPL